MGALPGGAGGIDDAGWIRHWVSTNNLSQRADWTQDSVQDYYRADVSSSPGWANFINIFFNSIMGGFKSITDLIGKIVEAVTGSAVGTLLTMKNFFVDRWNDLVSITDQVGNFIRSIVAGVSNILDDVPVVGNILSDVWDAVARMLGLSSNAQDTADTANKEIALMKARMASGGTIILDDFDRASATSLGTNWTQTYSLSGGGSMGMDGNGNAVWKASGTTSRKCAAYYNAATLSTDHGIVSTVIKQGNHVPGVGESHNYNYICGRLSTGGTRYLYVRWRSNRLYIGRCDFGSDWDFIDIGFSSKAGTVIELEYGGPRLGTYGWEARVNGSQAAISAGDITTNPTDDGAGNYFRGVGLNMWATNAFARQSVPASLQVFTAVDAT